MSAAQREYAGLTARIDGRGRAENRHNALTVRLGSLLCLSMLWAFPVQGKDVRLQTLEAAHAAFRSATNSAMYAEAARQYEYLLEDEGIRNGELFYTLGNSWFMAGEIGRAILYYRRAEKYLPNNADLQHNLQVALARRIDHIPAKEPYPLTAKLLGWHLHTSASLRWWVFGACWLVFWSARLWALRTTKKEARNTAWAAGVLSAVLLASLVSETIMQHRRNPGVITAQEVLARKGDGSMYAPAFLEPLHAGTEFETLDHRGGWLHIRLADGQTCWIPRNKAEWVSLQ